MAYNFRCVGENRSRMTLRTAYANQVKNLDNMTKNDRGRKAKQENSCRNKEI